MVGTYIAAALVCAASLLTGRAILVLSGRAAWTWLEPAVGFAALMAVAGVLARLPGRGTLATLGVIALVAGSLLTLRRPYAWRDALWPGLAVAAVVALALAIPFAVSGRWGLIGMGFNNDIGLHLAWSEWLRSGFGPEPDTGYPLGPHGLAVAVAAFPGTTLGQAFTGEVIAIGVLTGLTSLAALRDLGPVRRVLAALLVAVTYLAASYFAQSAFKETAQALFVLAFSLALPWPGREPVPRPAVPLVVLAAGIAFSYSFAGLAWPLATLALWALTLPAVRGSLAPRRVAGYLRRPAVAAGIAAALALGALLAFAGSFGFAGGFGKVAGSNTYGPVSPFEALGVWPAADYRLDAPGGADLPVLAAVIGTVALVAGLIWWLRRRDLSAPVGLAACALLYVLSLPVSGEYSRAKALMIGAPLAALISLRGLLAGPPEPTAPRGRRLAWSALGVVFVAAAGYSSFLVLREAPVAPPGHGSELTAFRAQTHGREVLYGGQDRFAAYELLGADTSVPVVEFPDEQVRESPTKPFDTGVAYSPIDFDSFTYFTLNDFDYLVTSAAAWTSEPPPQFEEVARTASYVLWRHRGTVGPERRALPEGTEAAASVNCAAPETRIFVDNPGRAAVFPDVVPAPKERWDEGSELSPGDSTSQEVDLPPGRWNLSIQYFSPIDLTLRAPGLEQPLEAALDGARPNTISLANEGNYWPAGTIDSDGGSVRFTIEADEATTLQDLSGWDGEAKVGQLVAALDQPREDIPLREACGRWLDWYVAPPRAVGISP